MDPVLVLLYNFSFVGFTPLQMNKCLDYVAITGDGVRIGFYLKNGDPKAGLDGLFTRSGLTGLL